MKTLYQFVIAIAAVLLPIQHATAQSTRSVIVNTNALLTTGFLPYAVSSTRVAPGPIARVDASTVAVSNQVLSATLTRGTTALSGPAATIDWDTSDRYTWTIAAASTGTHANVPTGGGTVQNVSLTVTSPGGLTIDFVFPVGVTTNWVSNFVRIPRAGQTEFGFSPRGSIMDIWAVPDAYATADGEVYRRASGTNGFGVVAGTGDVVGPASAGNNSIVRFDGVTGKLIQDSSVGIDDTGVIGFPPGVRQTFNPDVNTPGINVGSAPLGGDPSTPINGDLWYDFVSEELRARINGSTVSLGAGGSGGDTLWHDVASAGTLTNTMETLVFGHDTAAGDDDNIAIDFFSTVDAGTFADYGNIYGPISTTSAQLNVATTVAGVDSGVVRLISGNSTAEVRAEVNGVVNFNVLSASGYSGAGTLFLSDDGTYKSAGGSGDSLWTNAVAGQVSLITTNQTVRINPAATNISFWSGPPDTDFLHWATDTWLPRNVFTRKDSVDASLYPVANQVFYEWSSPETSTDYVVGVGQSTILEWIRPTSVLTGIIEGFGGIDQVHVRGTGSTTSGVAAGTCGEAFIHSPVNLASGIRAFVSVDAAVASVWGMNVSPWTLSSGNVITSGGGLWIEENLAVFNAGVPPTNWYGLRIDQQTVGRTNYAIYTDEPASSTNWAYYGAGTAKSRFGGTIDLPNNVALRGRNAADTADVEIIKLNAANETEISTIWRLNAAGTVGNGVNIVLGTTTGTKIGTGTTQKMGFYNATPIVQPASTTDLRQALINLGFLATGGATPLDLNGGALTAATVTAGGVNVMSREFLLACSDLTTSITAGTGKAYFYTPYACTVTRVKATLDTPQTSGATFTVDINEAGVSILSTKLTIDNTEPTSITAAVPPVISDTALADNAKITIDVDGIGDGTAKGLIVEIDVTRP